MDSFTRNYTVGLVVVVVLALGWLWLGGDERVDELNEILATDSDLSDYPYQFRVLSLENGIATMSSPRSAEVAAMQFLRTAYPELSKTAADHPDMMAAQDLLAKTQSRAQMLIADQFDIKAVRWEIDERWFNEHGVFLMLDP